MIRATGISAGLLALVVAAPVSADDFRVRTEVGLGGNFADATSLEAFLGFQQTYAANAGTRLMWEGSAEAFSFEFHGLVNFTSGSQVAARDAVAGTVPPPTLFDLSHTWTIDDETRAIGMIDRASLTYTTDNLVLRGGRQAITWGSGMVFHPSDIVAPFAPDAIDTTYKPGVDMLYGQYLFDNGADIQAIAVPRAATWGGRVSLDESTLALRASASFGEIDASAMLAVDRGDYVGSIGLSGPLGGASWNAEYVHWRLENGDDRPMFLVNVSNFATLGEWNVSYFAEYYHNGFGVDAAVAADALPVSLTKRMSTGQVFLGGQDFFALGGQVQMTPDLTVTPNAIISLNDRSALASIGINYSLGDNTDLSFDYSHPIGADGTEFGGRETTAGSGAFVGPARSANLRLVHYF